MEFRYIGPVWMRKRWRKWVGHGENVYVLRYNLFSTLVLKPFIVLWNATGQNRNAYLFFWFL